MKFSVVTLFPEACDAYLNASILGRARKEKKIVVKYQTPRDFAKNKWDKVDERPYGGGPGMVMQALPIVRAAQKALQVRGARYEGRGKKPRTSNLEPGTSLIVCFNPVAKQFTNKDADALAKCEHVVLVCGRYEGIDERAKKILKTLATVKEFAVGEAVYTGGEVPAMAIVDAVTRRLPGVLGKDVSVEERRVASHAVYTRPETISYKGKKYRVPAVLKTGHHANIDKWRKIR